MERAWKQMSRTLLRSASKTHLARSHLFLKSTAGLKRTRLWPSIMQSDVLVYDFQDGCPPEQRSNVFASLQNSHITFPHKVATVRLSDLDSEDCDSKIFNEIRASVLQRNVHWLMIPMIDYADELNAYIDIIDSIDPDWLSTKGQLQLICETPSCLHNLDDILEKHPDIAAVVVGSGDYLRFVQGSPEVINAQLRFEVLNKCQRHGRFVIDGPTTNLSQEQAIAFYRASHDGGMRSSLVLHPTQVKAANVVLSPDFEEVNKTEDRVKHWIATRETGYKLGSKRDFLGPPHLKKMLWEAMYKDAIRAKSTSFLTEAEPYKNLLSRFIQDKMPHSFHSILSFIALQSAVHPEHYNLIANLGFSECRLARPGATISEAELISTSVLDRSLTSKGHVVATYAVEILDEDKNTLFTMKRRYLEKPKHFHDSIDREGTSVKASEANQHVQFKRDHMDELARCVRKPVWTADFTSPSNELHVEFCKLLRLDAPIHHKGTVELAAELPPVIPSTMHLSCHQLPLEDGMVIDNVVFHSPMFSEKRCTVAHFIDDGHSERLVSVVTDEDGNILSSVFFRQESELLGDQRQRAYEVRRKIQHSQMEQHSVAEMTRREKNHRVPQVG